MAYGTDVDESLAHKAAEKEASEVDKLRARITELETQITPTKGKA